MAHFRIFVADNHDDEAVDAFTRHLDPEMGRRGMQWATVDVRTIMHDNARALVTLRPA